MKGIIVASFGSSHRDAYEKSIGKIRDRVKEAYPDYYVNECTSSDMVRKIIEKRDGYHYMNMGEALLDMENRGVTDVYILSLYVIKGVELEKIMYQANAYNINGGLNIKFSEALLETDEQIGKTAKALLDYRDSNHDAVIFMGHGSYHEADIVYEKLQVELDNLNSHTYVGTIEGKLGFDEIISRLAWEKGNKLLLAPFLLVAGDHAKNDMDSNDDSWRVLLEERGCEVDVILEGLCERDSINDIFMENLQGIL